MDKAAGWMRGFLKRKTERASERAALRAEALRRAAVDLAGHLYRHYGVRRVWLFGSLAWGDPTETADLDLAVEGLDPMRYFAALGDLLLEAPCRVDLVRLEEAPHALRQRIQKEGQLLDDPREDHG